MNEHSGAKNLPLAEAGAAEVAQEQPASEQAKNRAPGTRDDSGAGSPPIERMAILAPGGPLLMDVCFTIDGRAYAEVFAGLVAQVLAAADTDQDGRPTWKELAANEEYLAANQRDAQPIDPQQSKVWAERFDINHDGQIQPEEAAAWLGRDTGASARALVLRSSRWYHSNPSASSRVWHLLDSDRDGRLSAHEIARAPEQFWVFDADDDRAITPAELASLRDQLDAGESESMAVGRQVTRYAALHLDSSLGADQLEYLLADLYSPRQTLGRSSFRQLPGLFDRLDANSDGWLDRQELDALRTIEPHLRLAVEFPSGETSDLPATLAIQSQAPGVNVIAQSADRVVLQGAGTRLLVVAQDLPRASTTGPGVGRSEIHAMVHDQCDAVFEELDVNADGRLGEREVATAPERLQARDTNGDGVLAPDELAGSMIVAFLRGEPPNEQSFFIPSFLAQPADQRAPAWFVRGDFNGDGDISRREFLGSLEQFTRLDTNEDGFLSAEEAAAFKAD